MQRCYKPWNLFLPNLTPGKNKMIRYIWCIWHERFCLPSYFACMSPNHERNGPLARYVKLWGAHAPGMLGTFSPPPRVSNPDMHHGRCVAHVPWCLPGLLTSGFLWSRWWEKLSRYSRRMHDPHFYISGKRPMCMPRFFIGYLAIYFIKHALVTCCIQRSRCTDISPHWSGKAPPHI